MVKCSLHKYPSLGQNPGVLTSQVTFPDFPLSHSIIADFISDEQLTVGLYFSNTI